MSDYNSNIINPSPLALNKISSQREIKNDHLSKNNIQSYNNFKKELEEQINQKDPSLAGKASPDQLGEKGNYGNGENDLKLSAHANRRIQERNIDLNGDEFMKLKEAMQKLKEKGSKESLVITEKGAYILDVRNKTVVTAMDKKSLTDNIFTKIDSTLFLD